MKSTSPTKAQSNYFFEDQEPQTPDLLKEVVAGLTASPKSLNAKFFYDERGSQLFEEITRLPEYYITRTEISILKEKMPEIKRSLGEDSILIEYGSGNSEKIRLMIEELNPQAYVPIDISKDFLLSSTAELSETYPELTIHAICADYNEVVDIPTDYQEGNKVAFFPGSTIGNFTPGNAKKFLNNVRQTVGTEGSLLIGVDVKKDKEILHNAYNDSQGVTADFNLNMLNNLNETVQANFQLEHFEHDAFYNTEAGRIEMHLKSLKDHTVSIQNTLVDISQGETIHTENSYKYHIHEFIDLAEEVGFASDQVWSDKDKHFSVHYLKVA